MTIIGKSQAIQDMIKLINKVSGSKSNVLIIGESGTGKELAARMIHDHGPLAGKPFVPVNCGAIPENLFESEMFGHKRGSFTGAIGEKVGLFEAANGGTVFLDEVGELPLLMQVKLLRVLQDRKFRRVGGNDDIKVDIRVIAATNRDLEIGIKNGSFRDDLYYRLNVFQVKTPSLKSRASDIPLLVDHFIKKYNAKQKKQIEGIEPEALEVLMAHPWPGNVRELENAIERSVTLTSQGLIHRSVFPVGLLEAAKREPELQPEKPGNHASDIRVPAPRFDLGPVDLDAILGEVERTYLLAALEHAGQVKKKAAELLGITFRSLRYRLKKLGVDTGKDDDSADADE